MSSIIFQAKLAQEALKARHVQMSPDVSPSSSPVITPQPTPTMDIPSPSGSPAPMQMLAPLQKLKKSTLRTAIPAQKLNKSYETITEQVEILPYEECKLQVTPASQKPVKKIKQLLICPNDELFQLEYQLQPFTEDDSYINVLLKNGTDQTRTVQLTVKLQV